jgi:hypothetical protein
MDTPQGGCEVSDVRFPLTSQKYKRDDDDAIDG